VEATNKVWETAMHYHNQAASRPWIGHHHWIADALDDGLRLAVIVDNVKPGWLRRRAKFVGTRIIVLYGAVASGAGEVPE
jgi:hypothetical protein